VSQVVPYSGYLDRDGAPTDGAVQLRFRIFDAANAPEAPEPDPCDGSGAIACLWREEHPAVSVHNGAFSVRLGRPAGGQARDIAPILKLGRQLYLEVAVFDPGGARYVVLGRQELNPVPQSVFTLQEDLALRTLTTTQSVHVASGASVGAVGLGAGNIGAPASDFPLRVGANGAGSPNVGIDNDEIQAMTVQNGNASPAQLHLNPRGGNVYVGGTISAPGGIAAGGTVSAPVLYGDHVSVNLAAARPRIEGVFAYQLFPVFHIGRSSGGQQWDLGPANERVCFLAGMGINDAGNDGDRPQCVVSQQADRFILYTQTVGNAELDCWAACLLF
jgi:hypothetical protein